MLHNAYRLRFHAGISVAQVQNLTHVSVLEEYGQSRYVGRDCLRQVRTHRIAAANKPIKSRSLGRRAGDVTKTFTCLTKGRTGFSLRRRTTLSKWCVLGCRSWSCWHLSTFLPNFRSWARHFVDKVSCIIVISVVFNVDTSLRCRENAQGHCKIMFLRRNERGRAVQKPSSSLERSC